MSLILPWRNWYHCMGNTWGTWLPGDPKGFRTRHHREHVEGDYRFPPPPGYYDDLFQRSRHLMPRDAVFIDDELRPLVLRLFAAALQHHQADLIELSTGGVHWHLLARFVPAGIDPYDHLNTLGIKLTHHRRTRETPPPEPTPSATAPSESTLPDSAQSESPPPPGVGPTPGGRGLSRRGLSAYDHDPVPRRILGLVRSYVTHELKKAGHFPDIPGGLWALRPKCDPVRDRNHQVAVARYIRRHAEQRSAVLSLLPPE